MRWLKTFFSLLKASFNSFMEDNALKLSASLSYYTVFSIGPLFIIIISLAGWFYGRKAVEGELYTQLNDLVGSDAALQIQQIIQNIQETDQGLIGAIIGGVVLIIGATGVFNEMQSSLNFIWSIRVKPEKGWLRLLFVRLMSFSLIISMGFILLVSLVVSALLDVLSRKLAEYFEEATLVLFNLINIAVIVIVISALFTIIFKILPDASIRWKDAMVGALFTAVLFLAGKFGISYYLNRSDLGVTYGAAASIVILLSWVYYSALILYFGAEFTKIYAIKIGGGITPDKTAVFIIKHETMELPELQRHPEEEKV